MGCFQVFEDHEGIEADIRRRLAGLGGGPEARSSGQRPALLVVSPRAALRSPITAACRTALLPGDPPLPSWRSRPPAPSAMAQAHATPSPCPAGPGTGFGWPSSGSWSPSRGRWWSVRNSRGGSPRLLPQAALAVAGALLLLGISRAALLPAPEKLQVEIRLRPLIKPTFPVYNKDTPPRGCYPSRTFVSRAASRPQQSKSPPARSSVAEGDGIKWDSVISGACTSEMTLPRKLRRQFHKKSRRSFSIPRKVAEPLFSTVRAAKPPFRNSPRCSEFAPHSRRGRSAPLMRRSRRPHNEVIP